jgi:hypothetical protein
MLGAVAACSDQSLQCTTCWPAMYTYVSSSAGMAALLMVFCCVAGAAAVLSNCPPGSIVSGGSCVQCRAGTSSPGGEATTCQQCKPGTYSGKRMHFLAASAYGCSQQPYQHVAVRNVCSLVHERMSMKPQQLIVGQLANLKSVCCCRPCALAVQLLPAPKPAALVQQAHTQPVRALLAAAPALVACTPAAQELPAAEHVLQARMQIRQPPALVCAARLAHTAARAPANAWSATQEASQQAMQQSASAVLLVRILMLVRSVVQCARLALSRTAIVAAAARLAHILVVERRSALPASLARLLAGMQTAACLARLATLLLLGPGSVSSVKLARTQVRRGADAAGCTWQAYIQCAHAQAAAVQSYLRVTPIPLPHNYCYNNLPRVASYLLCIEQAFLCHCCRSGE